MRRRGAHSAICACALAAAIVVSGCGADETSYSNKRIVKQLDLKKTEAGFAIDGDLFCEVEKRLLNDRDEVEAAIDRDELGLVIASREGNVGVQGRPPFAPDCADEAQRKLNKLDPSEG